MSLLGALLRRGRLALAGAPPERRERGRLELAARLGGPPRARVGPYRVEAASFPELLRLYDEIVLERAYAFASRRAEPRIVDCGANVGMASVWLLAEHPGARLLAFEPAPAALRLLERNLARNGLGPRVEVVAAAVGPEEGEVELFLPADGRTLVASTRPGRVEDARPLRVAAVRLADRLDGPVDLLKVDIEGSEVALLADLAGSGRLDRVEQMAVEVHHHLLPGAEELGEVLRLLAASGFGYQVQARLPRPEARGVFQDVLVRAYRRDIA